MNIFLRWHEGFVFRVPYPYKHEDHDVHVVFDATGRRREVCGT